MDLELRLFDSRHQRPYIVTFRFVQVARWKNPAAVQLFARSEGAPASRDVATLTTDSVAMALKYPIHSEAPFTYVLRLDSHVFRLGPQERDLALIWLNSVELGL